jgi:hypothetical protein
MQASGRLIGLLYSASFDNNTHMKDILISFRDWLPSIAVVVTGIWLLFQWVFGERLRRQKEIPSLDGKLSATVLPFGSNKLLITVEALWNNHSPLPVYLNIEKCRIDVFRIEPQAEEKNCVLILKKDLGRPICSHFFLVGMCEVNYFFEPNTASTIINHFVLEPGVYGIRMELHTDTVGVNWWKEMILDAHLHKSRDVSHD